MAGSGGVVVGAAIIRDRAGRILIAQRHSVDGPIADLWEFPGGKVEPGESLPACITREIREELGLEIAVSAFFCRVEYTYSPHLHIDLRAYLCAHVAGEPVPLDCQAVRWVAPAALRSYAFAPADEPIVAKLLG